LVEGEMVMVEGTLLGDLGPAKGRKAAAVAGQTPRYEVLAAAVRFDALARSRNADVGVEAGMGMESTDEEAPGGAAAMGLTAAELVDEVGSTPPEQPPDQPQKKKRPGRKKKASGCDLAEEGSSSSGGVVDAAATLARPKRRSRKKGARAEDEVAVAMEM
jgi:hypothetical protein